MESKLIDRPDTADKQHAREIFEGSAAHYATERERLGYFRAQIQIAMSMLTNVSAGSRVLDIGCAAGAEICDLRARGFAVVGIDAAAGMLERARLRFARDGQVHLCRADAERLPFGAESMDHVVCLGVFEFLPDYDAALNEIRRVLRPGGLAVFAIPSRISLYATTERAASLILAPPWRAIKRCLGNAKATAGRPFRRNLCVPWRYRARLREHGLEPVQSRFSNYFVYPLDRFPRIEEKVCRLLEPLASWPLLRYGASVYLVSARKQGRH